MTTSFAEWREYGDNLGRFASIREKADSPMDRIVVQNKDGIQKVVAGDYNRTLIITTGPTSQPNGRAVVPSRLLLGTLKTLKGKGDATVRVTDKGATVETSFGSSIEMDNLMTPFKMLAPRPYNPSGWIAKLPEGFLPAAAKYLAYTAEQHPFNQVLAQTIGHDMFFRSTENHIQAEVGPIPVEVPRTIHFPEGLFPAMRGLEAAGGIFIPLHVAPQVHQAQFGSGKYRVVTVIYPDYGTFPLVAAHPYTVRVQADKKLLIDIFKSLAGRHEYSRVVMEAKDGALTIRSGDNGAAKPNVECEGTGTLPVNATFMAKVLQTVDGKTATIEFADSPSHIRIVGDANRWPILISPMK